MSRSGFLLFLMCAAAFATQKQPAPAPAAPSTTVEQEPPEEDPDMVAKTYSFNPLEASRNITAGDFYFKKGNYRAASRRYLEASKWDPTSGDALLKLAESDEKMRNFDGARDAYTKYIPLAPDPKAAAEAKKKLDKLPKPRVSSTTSK